MRDKYHRLMREHRLDALLTPVGPTPAPLIGTAKYWRYTSIFNILDWPAAVFPTGRRVSAADPEMEPFKLGTRTRRPCTRSVSGGWRATAHTALSRRRVQSWTDSRRDVLTSQNRLMRLQTPRLRSRSRCSRGSTRSGRCKHARAADGIVMHMMPHAAVTSYTNGWYRSHTAL
jgi:hypothetical protein